MVADAAPPKTSKAAMRNPAPRFDLVTRLKVRSLYVIQGLSSSEIAEQAGLDRRQVQNLIYREKWTGVKQSTRKRVEEKSLARTQREVEEIVEAVAVKTEELAMGSLNAAGEVLESKAGEYWAKDVQALSQAAKNFVGLARQARGLADSNGNSDTKGAATLIFVALDRVEARPAKGEPKLVHELAPSEVSETPAIAPTPPNPVA